jgi:hypothetical protein
MIKKSNPFTCGNLIPPNPHRYWSFLVDSFKKIGDIERNVWNKKCGSRAVKEEAEQTTNSSITTTSRSLQTATTTDAWMLFLYALKTPATKDSIFRG